MTGSPVLHACVFALTLSLQNATKQIVDEAVRGIEVLCGLVFVYRVVQASLFTPCLPEIKVRVVRGLIYI